jgi:hypothetical protein
LTTFLDPLGLDLYGLGQALHALTGTPNPIPRPVHRPPAPTPAADADVALDQALTQLDTAAAAWRAAHDREAS